MSDIEPINKAIDSYGPAASARAEQITTDRPAGSDVAYSNEFMAEIYAPRVQQLRDLAAQGFTHAEWKWNADLGERCWHGAATPDTTT